MAGKNGQFQDTSPTFAWNDKGIQQKLCVKITCFGILILILDAPNMKQVC